MTFDPPIPPPKWRSDKYGLGEIPVNGTKFIPYPATGSRENMVRAIYYHAERKGKRFVCRQWEENGIEGIRVWRFS